jgi:hypothetical protein
VLICNLAGVAIKILQKEPLESSSNRKIMVAKLQLSTPLLLSLLVVGVSTVLAVAKQHEEEDLLNKGAKPFIPGRAAHSRNYQVIHQRSIRALPSSFSLLF